MHQTSFGVLLLRIRDGGTTWKGMSSIGSDSDSEPHSHGKGRNGTFAFNAVAVLTVAVVHMIPVA